MHLPASFFLLSLFANCVAVAAEAPKINMALDVYAKPAMLVDIGAGRHLNLRCAGSGSPTVIFESGAIADSLAWHSVQPAIAKVTRACAYDRAGLGFSDEGPLPRDVDASVRDLHALIVAAHIATPVILVGHSLGTNIVRSYADAHVADVAAIVLLDPPAQNVAEFSPAWQKVEDEGSVAGLASVAACARGAENGQLDAPPANLKSCLRGPNPEYSTTLNTALRGRKIKPAFWHTVLSVESTNDALYKQPVSASENHASVPLIVLEPDGTNADALPADREALDAASQKTHRLIAATSTRGRVVPVAHSSHDIQFDRPEVVVRSVHDVIREAKEMPGAGPAR